MTKRPVAVEREHETGHEVGPNVFGREPQGGAPDPEPREQRAGVHPRGAEHHEDQHAPRRGRGGPGDEIAHGDVGDESGATEEEVVEGGEPGEPGEGGGEETATGDHVMERGGGRRERRREGGGDGGEGST